MKKVLFVKILLGYILASLFIILVLFTFSLTTLKRQYLESKSQDLQRFAESLKHIILPFLEKGNTEELQDFVLSLGKSTQVRITVVDRSGKVLADSEENPERMESHRFRPEIQTSLEGEVGKTIRWNSTVKEDMLYLSLPLSLEGKTAGALRVSLFLRDISHLLSRIKKDLFLGFSIAFLFFSIFAIVYSWNLNRGMEELANGLRRFSSGDFRFHLPLRSGREFRELHQKFNEMADRTNELLSRWEEKREELEAIISAAGEAIALLDREGKILSFNEKFRLLFASASLEGKYFWEVIRSSRFSELFFMARDKKKTVKEEISLADRPYIAKIAYIPSREKVLIILQDISEEKNVERVKRELVANVSHELRTPLAMIKGFVETLEDEEMTEKADHYLKIIKRNVERLDSIIRDLLTLSELEGKKDVLEWESVDIKELILRVAHQFEPQAGRKGLFLKLEIAEDLPPISGDGFRLEQMLINLLDNAIKYTEKGRVTVRLSQSEKELFLAVEDTGIGIAEEHLPRIFERFYVVDKSRSRSLGGTGLGLAIVKHIVLLHGGKIWVKSTEGEGTTFTISLPL